MEKLTYPFALDLLEPLLSLGFTPSASTAATAASTGAACASRLLLRLR